MEKIKARLFLILLFILVAGYLCFPVSASAEKMTHTVKKGDTLWDICEKYYGDSSLWPKLWEMNSFITNPHLLSPGDVITLFDKVPQKVTEPEPEPVQAKEPPAVMGIDIEGIIQNSNRIGFYSSGKLRPWGMVYAAAEDHLILAKGNSIYVLFEKDKNVTIGDEFSIGKIRPVKNPTSNKKAGYVFDVSGKLAIEKKAGQDYYRDGSTRDKENSYQAKIIESYEPVEIGDLIVPVNNITGCILPLSNNVDILARVVAGANKQSLIPKYGVVYMDKGLDAGVQKGNVFEIREGNIVKDPKPDKKLTFFEEQVVLPDRVIGQVIVIDTYPDSATALVLSATEALEPGTYLKNISWTETPDFILNKATCPIE